MKNPWTSIVAVLCIVFGVCVSSTIDANIPSPGTSPLGNERPDFISIASEAIPPNKHTHPPVNEAIPASNDAGLLGNDSIAESSDVSPANHDPSPPGNGPIPSTDAIPPSSDTDHFERNGIHPKNHAIPPSIEAIPENQDAISMNKEFFLMQETYDTILKEDTSNTRLGNRKANSTKKTNNAMTRGIVNRNGLSLSDRLRKKHAASRNKEILDKKKSSSRGDPKSTSHPSNSFGERHHPKRTEKSGITYNTFAITHRNHTITNKNQSIIRRNRMKTLRNPPNNARHKRSNTLAHTLKHQRSNPRYIRSRIKYPRNDSRNKKSHSGFPRSNAKDRRSNSRLRRNKEDFKRDLRSRRSRSKVHNASANIGNNSITGNDTVTRRNSTTSSSTGNSGTNSGTNSTANSIANSIANSDSSTKTGAKITSNGTSKVDNINNKILGTENTLDGKSTGQSANRKMEEGRRDAEMRNDVTKDGPFAQNQKPTMNIFKMDGDGMHKSVLDEGDDFIAACWAWENIGYDKKFYIYNGSEEIPCKDMRIANKEGVNEMGRRLCTRNDLTVSRSDNGGLWYCVAVMDEKPYSASQITQLNVLFNTMDIFLTTPHHHLDTVEAVEVGEEVNFTCVTGSANPAPRIQWLTGNQPIGPSDVYRIEEYEVDGDYRGKYTTSTLRFVAQPQHLKETYDCAIADNVQVRGRGRKKRIVKRATQITIEGYNGPLLVGDTLNLQCKSSYNALKKYVWTVSELETAKHFTIIAKTSKLVINNVESKHAGWYTCTAFSGSGREAEQSSGKIFVKVLPNDTSSIDYPEFPKTQPQVLSEENSKLATLGGGVVAIIVVVCVSVGLFTMWKKRRRAPDQELLT